MFFPLQEPLSTTYLFCQNLVTPLERPLACIQAACRPCPLTWRDLDLKTDTEKAKAPPGQGTGPTEILKRRKTRPVRGPVLQKYDSGRDGRPQTVIFGLHRRHGRDAVRKYWTKPTY